MSEISEPALAAIILLAVLCIFGLGRLGSRRYPGVPEQVDAVHGRLGQLETRVGSVERHLSTVEADGAKTKHDVGNIRMQMRGLPTIKDVSELKVQIAEIGGKVEGVSGKVAGMGDVLHRLGDGLSRIEDFMLKATANRIVSGREREDET